MWTLRAIGGSRLDTKIMLSPSLLATFGLSAFGRFCSLFGTARFLGWVGEMGVPNPFGEAPSTSQARALGFAVGYLDLWLARGAMVAVVACRSTWPFRIRRKRRLFGRFSAASQQRENRRSCEKIQDRDGTNRWRSRDDALLVYQVGAGRCK